MQNTSAAGKVDPSIPHRRQSFWRIYFPLTVAGLIVVGLAVFAAVAAGPGNSATAQWAEISTIWLVMPLIGTLLLFTAGVAGMIYLLARMIHGTPHVFRTIYGFFVLVNQKTTAILDGIAAPVIKVGQWNAGWKAFWRRFRR